MKMDAMQKRKMWKVAIAHFGLTLLVIVWVELITPKLWSVIFLFSTLDILQPQLLIFHRIGLIFYLSEWTYRIILLASFPVWSFCFGWLYVKFTNWLNHFPVLGRKVF